MRLTFCIAALMLTLFPPIASSAEEQAEQDKGVYEDYHEATSKLKLLEINGYLRLRTDLFHNLSLHNNSGFYEPITEVATQTDQEGQVSRPRARSAGTLAGASLRFRLEPTINVSEGVRILSQIDILDNLTMGSTPDTYGTSTPSALSETQLPPSDGVNALKDSIRVKRVWGEVLTPLGQLRFGRMPLHFGMGMLYNDGNCLDCDQGDTVDRVSFVVKVAGYYIIPSWDFAAEGPSSDSRGTWHSHPIDLDQLDDVNQYGLVLMKKDSNRDIKEALDNNGWILNYGLYTVYRQQSLSTDILSNPVDDPYSIQARDMVQRNYQAWTWDLWGLFIWREFKLETELAVIWGNMDARGITGDLDVDPDSLKGINMLQVGFVGRGSYSMLSDKLHLSLEVGYASGDTDEGFGAKDPMSQVKEDKNLNNFRFSPDFHVDRILWREIIGRVTDALYIKPRVSYTFAPGLGASLDAVYSLCEKANSSPGDNFNLGLELDASLTYTSEQGFFASLTYGIFFPFDGFKRVQESVQEKIDWSSDPGIAHTVQGRLGIVF
ncbi:MAG: TIGR04551 family protein [Deltaproteobacteria bacterium]|nr:TIGR04551 family protein [Deltaproteobacteria bacterium]